MIIARFGELFGLLQERIMEGLKAAEIRRELTFLRKQVSSQLRGEKELVKAVNAIREDRQSLLKDLAAHIKQREDLLKATNEQGLIPLEELQRRMEEVDQAQTRLIQSQNEVRVPLADALSDSGFHKAFVENER